MMTRGARRQREDPLELQRRTINRLRREPRDLTADHAGRNRRFVLVRVDFDDHHRPRVEPIAGRLELRAAAGQIDENRARAVLEANLAKPRQFRQRAAMMDAAVPLRLLLRPVRTDDKAQRTQRGLLWTHFVLADVEGIDERPSTSMPFTSLHTLAPACVVR